MPFFNYWKNNGNNRGSLTAQTLHLWSFGSQNDHRRRVWAERGQNHPPENWTIYIVVPTINIEHKCTRESD